MKLSDRRLRFGRLQMYIDPRDAWVGVYVDPRAFYVLLVPFVVFRWARPPIDVLIVNDLRRSRTS